MTNSQYIDAYKKTQQSSNSITSSHEIVRTLMKELVNSKLSTSEYFDISFKFASPAKEEIGINKPKVAGATNKLLKSFIKTSHYLKYIKGNVFD